MLCDRYKYDNKIEIPFKLITRIHRVNLKKKCINRNELITCFGKSDELIKIFNKFNL